MCACVAVCFWCPFVCTPLCGLIRSEEWAETGIRIGIEQTSISAMTFDICEEVSRSLAPSLIPLSISMYLLAFKRLMMPTRAATQAMPGDDDDIDNLRLQFPQRSVFDHLH